MKTIKTGILILFICLSTKTLNAQLQNTAWKGVFMAPTLIECVLEFKTDTLNVNEVNNDNILETSVYKINNDTLTLQKVTGGSPCGNEVIGKYRFAINNDKLSISLIEDDCRERALSFPAEPYEG